ncbi:MAG: HAD family hydrolase [Saccharofermentanales bacterium]|jgi:putative hydrolase of the HAD superfamily
MMNMNLPPARPTHLILDLGGVLVRLNSVAWLWSEADQSETMTGSEQIWQTSTTVKAYETGQIKDLETFYRAARHEMGITVDRATFFARFPGLIGELFAETIPVLTRLQAAYTLYLLSNIGEAHWIYCRDQLGLGSFFQQTFLSYEMGVLKPDQRIFRQMLQSINQPLSSICYFDDRRENIEEALRLGIYGLVTEGAEALQEHLYGLRLLEP